MEAYKKALREYKAWYDGLVARYPGAEETLPYRLVGKDRSEFMIRNSTLFGMRVALGLSEEADGAVRKEAGWELPVAEN